MRGRNDSNDLCLPTRAPTPECKRGKNMDLLTFENETHADPTFVEVATITEVDKDSLEEGLVKSSHPRKQTEVVDEERKEKL